MNNILLMEKNYAKYYLNLKQKYLETSQDKEKIEAFFSFFDNEKEKESNLDIIEGVAHINITGPLTRKGPSFWTRFFGLGGSSFEEIISQIEEANGNEFVESIQLNINSPGGEVDGVGEAAKAIRNSDKKVIAVVKSMAASAAFWLATQADTIIAASKEARVGSVGVVLTGIDTKGLEKEIGIKIIEVVNTKSPNKRVDIGTKKGQNILRGELDDLFDIMAADIATGRGVTVEAVIDDFGKGGMLVAPKAVGVNMIDSIDDKDIEIVGDPKGDDGVAEVQDPLDDQPFPDGRENQNMEDFQMTFEAWKKENPSLAVELHAKIRNESIEIGVKQERDRVNAHLKMGESFGATEFSHTCIREGKSLNEQEVQAEYMTAGRNKVDVEDKEKDNPDDIKPADTNTEASEEEKEKSLLDATMAIGKRDKKGA